MKIQLFDKLTGTDSDSGQCSNFSRVEIGNPRQDGVVHVVALWRSQHLDQNEPFQNLIELSVRITV